MHVDYSLYLVTGRELLPPGKDYLESLEEALKGGVTIVQIREKHADTGEFLQIAQESKKICDKYNVPMLINDRIDIALAVKAHGVHVGQSDMPISMARELLSSLNDFIIGVSCNTLQEVQKAISDGVDYVGIGAVYGTQTKQLTSPIVGVRNIGTLLEALDGSGIKAVAIGGIKSTNLLRTLHGSVSSSNHALDGVAVVSDIVASMHPQIVASQLSNTLAAFYRLRVSHVRKEPPTVTTILNGVIRLAELVKSTNPLVHQITNNVVATQSANVTLALGASPIMATAPAEMEDIAKVCGALLVNIGTLNTTSKEGMMKSGYFVNTERKPVVLDPVGVGASRLRKEVVKDLLGTWQASVIKGNAGELSALAGSTEVQSKGVDTVGSGFSNPKAFVRSLALKERCIVVLTGPVDYVSDGTFVVALNNGHEILGKITGSGCIVGSAIASFCAAACTLGSEAREDTDGRLVQGDMLLGAIGGVLAITIAAEKAMLENDAIKGPGTFLPGLIDALANLNSGDIKKLARVTVS